MYKSFIFLVILLLISINFIKSQTYCTSSINCDSCEFCGYFSKIYNECSYENSFCYDKNSQNYNYNFEIEDEYSNYFRSKSLMDSFCGQRDIDLDSMKKSFKIFYSESYTYSDNSYHCDYKITNQYYFDNKKDKASINFEIKPSLNDEKKKFKFNIFIIYKMLDSIIYYNYQDNHIRSQNLMISLDKVSDFHILIDFINPTEDTGNIEEYFQIKLLTNNRSKKEKILIIVFSIIFVLLLSLIIFYIIIKIRKENILKERMKKELIEKEETIKKNTKLIKELFQNELKPKLLTKNLIVNDCENCTICLEKFIFDKSIVCITTCKHIFHYNCLKNWIETEILNPQCPNCKHGFFSNSLPPTPRLNSQAILNLNPRNINKREETLQNDENGGISSSQGPFNDIRSTVRQINVNITEQKIK